MPGTRKLGKTTDQRMAMLRQQVTDFLANGKMETTITRAKDAGDAAAAFELELKINTVKRVLDARNAWWQEHAAELPEIPADIRDGREVDL